MSEVNWYIDWRNRSAGLTNSGASQLVVYGEPAWMADFELNLDRQGLRAWMGLQAALRGRVNLCRVPMVDPENVAQWEFGQSASAWNVGIPFSDGSYFSHGFGFEYSPFVLTDIETPAGAREILVDQGDAPLELRAGMLISHNDWPYRILAVEALSGTLRRIQIEMPVRRTIPAGTPILMLASGLFQLTADDVGRLKYKKETRHKVRVTLAEWVSRP